MKLKPRLIETLVLSGSKALILFTAFLLSTSIYSQKNPNRIVKKYVRQIEKGKTKDSIESLSFIVSALSEQKLKKKFLKSGSKTIELASRQAILSVEGKVDKSIVRSLKSDPYHQFLVYQNGLKKIQGCKSLTQKIIQAELGGVQQKDLANLDTKIANYQLKREELRKSASEDLYQKSSSAIVGSSKDKSVYRKAYKDLSVVDNLIDHYKKTDSLKSIAKDRGTTRVRMVSVAVEKSDYPQTAIRTVEKAIAN